MKKIVMRCGWLFVVLCLGLGVSGCAALSYLEGCIATNDCPGGVCNPFPSTPPGGGNGDPGCGPTGCPPVAVTSAIPSAITASPVEWCPTLDCVKQKAVATGKRIVFLVVGSPGCPWCSWMRDKVAQDEALRPWLEQHGLEIYVEMNNGVVDPAISALTTPGYPVPYTAVLVIQPDGSFRAVDGMNCTWLKLSDYTVRTDPAYIKEVAETLKARLHFARLNFCPNC